MTIPKRYLIDNNALGFVGSERRASRFFRERCRVPEDVSYEARGGPHAASIAGLVVEVTPAVLRKLVIVMQSVPKGDYSLVDLCGNKGSADPVTVATALMLNEQEEASLLPNEWVIVTRDRAVTTKAREFSVRTMAPEELVRKMDAEIPPV